MIAALSHALVAFTIELDNEFEHRMPHTTSIRRHPGGPWLTSVAMYENCLRFIDDRGVSLRDLTRAAGTPTNLNGMQRWGYVAVSPKRVITLTVAGKRAQQAWAPLLGEIEARWRQRFGVAEIDRFRQQLAAIVGRFPARLPDCLPILRYGLTTPPPPKDLGPEARNPNELSLYALLSKVLLQCALDFERESPVSLAISANVLRLIGDEGQRLRDLPRLSGVSKESLAMASKFLHARGYALVGGTGVKTITLTAKGRFARDTYPPANPRVAVDGLPADLLFQGIEPYADGWRASVPKREHLPDFPMVLHRGGYPDGA